MDKETKMSKDDMDNLVAVFSLLLKWDKKQNPENYKRQNNPEINYKHIKGEDSEAGVNKAFDILFEEVEKADKMNTG
jgi:hypothetical protein